MKVLTLVGTRPELIRLSCTIKAFKRNFDHILLHTGQNFDPNLSTIFYEDLELDKPEFQLQCGSASSSKTIGNILSQTDEIFEKISPDAIVILGDTNSGLAAISAKRRKIPIFHVEAGNRSFNFNVPEEINRKIIDHVSDINICYSNRARECLIREGLKPEMSLVLGSPMKEVLNFYWDKISQSDVQKKLDLKAGSYYVVSVHRSETITNLKKLEDFIAVLRFLSSKKNKKVVLSLHPNTMDNLNKRGLKMPKNIIVSPPFNFTDYVSLMKNSDLVFSDSGTLAEESALMNLKAINLREEQERHEAMDEGATILVGFNKDRILDAVAFHENRTGNQENVNSTVQDYEVSNFSEKMVKTVISYTDYVNRIVWQR